MAQIDGRLVARSTVRFRIIAVQKPRSVPYGCYLWRLQATVAPGGQALSARILRERILLSLLVLPWLWPFTPGPSASVGPLLAAWCCALLAASVLAWDADPRGLLGRALPASWRIAASISAVIGLAQYFGVAPETHLISTAQLGEAYGNLRQKNQFATLMSIGFAAFIWQVDRAGPERWIAVALLAAGNAASASRTGLLEWVVIAVLLMAWRPRERATVALCGWATAAYVLASFALPHAFAALHGDALANVFSRAMGDFGCSSRRVLWANVLQLISLRPWTGWGVGELDYAHYATLYSGDRFCDILDNAHNLPLHLAVELGAPAALLAMGAIGMAIWRGRPWRAQPGAERLAWTALTLIGLHSLLEYPLWYGPFQLAVLCSVALVAPLRVQSRRASVVVICIGALGLSVLAWAAVLYGEVSQAYKLPEERRPAYQRDPIAAAGRPMFFEAQLRFAELSLLSVDRRSAPRTLELARDMLHYSPEPMVIEKLIESAALLGRTDEAMWHALRFRAAFPERYAAWRTETSAVALLPGLP